MCTQKMKKSRTVNLRNISRTHYAKRSKAGHNFRPWVEIKAFANVQELLNADKIANVLPIMPECRTFQTDPRACKGNKVMPVQRQKFRTPQFHIFSLVCS